MYCDSHIYCNWNQNFYIALHRKIRENLDIFALGDDKML